MKSICINLDSRKDKWEEVQPEFTKLGVTPERFSAIIGEITAMLWTILFFQKVRYK